MGVMWGTEYWVIEGIAEGDPKGVMLWQPDSGRKLTLDHPKASKQLTLDPDAPFSDAELLAVVTKVGKKMKRDARKYDLDQRPDLQREINAMRVIYKHIERLYKQTRTSESQAA